MREAMHKAVVPALAAIVVLGLGAGCVPVPRRARAGLELETATSDEWTLVAYRHRPERLDPGRLPVVLCHGVGSNSSIFNLSNDLSLAQYLAERGWDVWNVNLRGAGLSTKPLFHKLREVVTPTIPELPKRFPHVTIIPEQFNWTMDDYALQDVPAIVELVLRSTGHKRLIWVGHSMGGVIMLMAVRHRPELGDHVAGTVLIGTSLTTQEPLNDIMTEIKRDRQLLKFIYLIINTRLPTITTGAAENFEPDVLFYNRSNVTADAIRRMVILNTEDIAAGVIDQLMDGLVCGRLRSHDKTMDYSDPKALGGIRFPALLVAGRVDDVAPAAGVKHLYDALGSADRTMRVMSRTNGYSADYGHMDLLMGRNAPEEVYPYIAALIERHGKEADPAR
jgi:lysosomal acid lipase/cholesteryl ester hydrolase